EKTFFIQTLTKDIDLVEAVLDLIDNAIDSYIKNGLTGRTNINLSFSETTFAIEDFCGGIEKEAVYEHVFAFGAPSETKARTVGVFGIGLKRSIFKMGRNILIESDDGT